MSTNKLPSEAIEATLRVAIVSVNEGLFEDAWGDDARVLEALSARVRRLSVVVPTRRRDREAVRIGEATVVPVPMISRAEGFIGVVRALRRIHRSSGLDIIQAQEPAFTGLAGLAACRRTRSRLVVGAFGVDPGDPGFARASPLHMVAAPVSSLVLRRAALIQVDSVVIAERMSGRNLPVRFKPMTPLNLPMFLAAGARRQTRRQGNQLLFVGRFGRQKRLSLLLEAFVHAKRDCPGLRLTLVGDGPERLALERRIRRLGLDADVTLLKSRSQEDLVDIYLGADLLLLSSRYEGMPRVFMEAAATGLPIVSTPVAGALELRRDAEIEISPPDARLFGRSVAQLARDAGARARVATSLRASMERRAKEGPATEHQLAVWRDLMTHHETT